MTDSAETMRALVRWLKDAPTSVYTFTTDGQATVCHPRYLLASDRDVIIALLEREIAALSASGTKSDGGDDCACGKFGDGLTCPGPDGVPLCVAPGPIAGLEPVAWQPIKTAPRDGTPILCFTPDYQSEFSDQSGIDVLWFDEGAWLYNAEPVTFQPTHWMPLPASPNSASSGYYTRAQLEAHAAEQVRAEREACATEADRVAELHIGNRDDRLGQGPPDTRGALTQARQAQTATAIATAIRARGQS